MGSGVLALLLRVPLRGRRVGSWQTLLDPVAGSWAAHLLTCVCPLGRVGLCQWAKFNHCPPVGCCLAGSLSPSYKGQILAVFPAPQKAREGTKSER